LEPFIVTLAGLQMARRLALILSGNGYINISYGDGSGQWAATFTYPTGAAEALNLAEKILIDCAASVPEYCHRTDAGDHEGQRGRNLTRNEVLD
jgi:ribose/xylose/arabinose/galactoside ABC-type transport system permease subunit